MAVGGTYFYGLGVNESVYPYNITTQQFILTSDSLPFDIGALSSTERQIFNNNYISAGDVIGLSSSNAAYTPITSHKIVSAKKSDDDAVFVDVTHTDSDFTISTRSAYLYVKISVEAVSSGISLDLSTIGLPAGTHSIQMKLSDDGVTKADSELSNAVTYTVSSGETWVFNDTPDVVTSLAFETYFNINFICNGINYVKLGRGAPAIQSKYLAYWKDATSLTNVCFWTDGWIDQAYRTVTFETAPTGELLTWLQANAVKQ